MGITGLNQRNIGPKRGINLTKCISSKMTTKSMIKLLIKFYVVFYSINDRAFNNRTDKPIYTINNVFYYNLFV